MSYPNLESSASRQAYSGVRPLPETLDSFFLVPSYRLIVSLDGTSLTIGNPWLYHFLEKKDDGFLAPMRSGLCLSASLP
ncbi:MAG: hypothetical protein AB4057_09425 [Crocosphaera sp.]